MDRRYDLHRRTAGSGGADTAVVAEGKAMPSNPVKSAARVLQLMELFAEVRAPLRQNSIVTRLAYPQSSTTDLLKSLVGLGYLNYHRASRTYFPTTRVAALGEWVNHYTLGSGELIGLMHRIQTATHETVALVSQNDLYIQYLRVIAPDHPLKFPPPEGTMRLLTQSSAGLVLLSRMSDSAVARLIRHIDARGRGEVPRTDVPGLLEQIRGVRLNGYAYLAGIPVPQAATVSLPLPDGPHGIPMAIGVGGATARITRNRDRIVAAMREALSAYRAAIASLVVAGEEDGGTRISDMR